MDKIVQRPFDAKALSALIMSASTTPALTHYRNGLEIGVHFQVANITFDDIARRVELLGLKPTNTALYENVKVSGANLLDMIQAIDHGFFLHEGLSVFELSALDEYERKACHSPTPLAMEAMSNMCLPERCRKAYAKMEAKIRDNDTLGILKLLFLFRVLHFVPGSALYECFDNVAFLDSLHIADINVGEIKKPFLKLVRKYDSV